MTLYRIAFVKKNKKQKIDFMLITQRRKTEDQAVQHKSMKSKNTYVQKQIFIETVDNNNVGQSLLHCFDLKCS